MGLSHAYKFCVGVNLLSHLERCLIVHCKKERTIQYDTYNAVDFRKITYLLLRPKVGHQAHLFFGQWIVSLHVQKHKINSIILIQVYCQSAV